LSAVDQDLRHHSQRPVAHKKQPVEQLLASSTAGSAKHFQVRRQHRSRQPPHPDLPHGLDGAHDCAAVVGLWDDPGGNVAG
jgi:hypothetical protein